MHSYYQANLGHVLEWSGLPAIRGDVIENTQNIANICTFVNMHKVNFCLTVAKNAHSWAFFVVLRFIQL